jgi:hypothetical protein
MPATRVLSRLLFEIKTIAGEEPLLRNFVGFSGKQKSRTAKPCSFDESIES